MRPVNRGAVPPAYATAVNKYVVDLSSSSGISTNVNNLFNTLTPTWNFVVQFINALATDLNTNNKDLDSNPGPIGTVSFDKNMFSNLAPGAKILISYHGLLSIVDEIDIDMSSNLAGKITTTYKKAATPLITNIGPYCSYCETPLLGLAEVEHMLAKDVFPVLSIDWKNFLIACGPCNNAKKDKPSTATVRAWTFPVNTPKPSVAPQYFTAIVGTPAIPGHYLFPTGNGAYQKMPVILAEKTIGNTGDYKEVKKPYDFANILDGIDYMTKVVTAKVKIGTAAPAAKDVTVLINSKQPTATVPSPAFEMQNKLCQLNVVGTLATTYDRRVMNRTIAWFRILAIIKPLIEASGGSGYTSASFNAHFLAIVYSSAHIGFYSVWVTILNGFIDPTSTTTPKQNLSKKFITETCPITQTPIPLYPGTQTTNVP